MLLQRAATGLGRQASLSSLASAAKQGVAHQGGKLSKGDVAALVPVILAEPGGDFLL